MGQEREQWSFPGVESATMDDPGPWVHGSGRAGSICRTDRALQCERFLGVALWFLLAAVLLEFIA